MADSIFSGVREKWLPLYNSLKETAREQLGGFEERRTQGTIQWRHNSAFAEISAKKDCLVIGFASETIHDEWEADKVVQTSKNRVAHYFNITDESMFSQLLERMALSYALTYSGKPRPQPAKKQEYSTIDEYIASFPPDVRVLLERVRETIRTAAPDATEKISWQMPTFYLNGNLVHFAAYKSHIGFYPIPSGIEAFRERFNGYKTTKGGIQFPLDKPIPYDLISDITRFRAQENRA